jgi:hypothetical protein
VLQIGNAPDVGGHSIFDNSYYHILLGTCKAPPPKSTSAAPRRRGLLQVGSCQAGFPSDSNLLSDPTLAGWVQKYEANNARFLSDFRAAYVKMMELGQN